MKFTKEWLKDHLNTKKSEKQIIEKLNGIGLEVEKVEPIKNELSDFIVAKIIKAPFFYVAVGSQANVGGAASAPIVASAFSPSLAPVGVLLAVLGYAVGTFGAIICTLMMQALSS